MTLTVCRAATVVLVAALALTLADGNAVRLAGATPHGGGIVATPGAQPEPVAADPLAAATTFVAVKAPRGARGYTLFSSRLIGQVPTGLNVWVSPKARHHKAIASLAAAAISRQRHYGIDIRWRGYGSPRAATGVVTIIESNAGCRGGAGVVGVTWPQWMRLPNGDLYIDRAAIALCPKLFTRYGSALWRATVEHELGHAVGLAHTNYAYRGSLEVMNAMVRPTITTYRAGDARGLRALAANKTRIKRETPPIGRFERSAWQPNNTIVFTGWALLSYYHSTPVRITLTDNGRTVEQAGTTVLRPDVNNRYDRGTRHHGYSISIPWNGGTHTYCVRATSPLSSVSTVNLGCVTWRA